MSRDSRGSARARRHRARAWILAPLLATAAAGCGTGRSGSAPDAGADASTDASAGETGDAACNGLTQLGALVTPVCDSGPPAGLEGGPIAHGTYVLTEARFFHGCSSAPLAETLVVSQGTAQSIATDAAGGTQVKTVTFTLGGSGAITETQTCPVKIALTTSYSATPTTLTIVLSNALATRVSTFTLH